jgi:hypothetical protein
MQYAIIDRNTLELTITSRKSRAAATISSSPGRSDGTWDWFREYIEKQTYQSQMCHLLVYEVLYPAKFRELETEPRRRRNSSKLGNSKKRPTIVIRSNPLPSLAPADPWLLAITGLMWEGVVQGASWDLIKIAVKAGLAKLQAAKLAPTSTETRHSTKSVTTRVGFHWTSYVEGAKQREMFVGIRRAYKQWQIEERKPAGKQVKVRHHIKRIKARRPK